MPPLANAASKAALSDDDLPLAPHGLLISLRPHRLSTAGLAVTARTVTEALVGWVGVPAEALLD